jgi:taurine dioxygenase
MQVEPFGAIGADVHGVDVVDVDSSMFTKIYAAWLEYAILRFRDQCLDDISLRDFSRRFGPLEYAPMGLKNEVDQAKVANPYVASISNILVDGRPIGGLGAAEANWHTDMSYIEHPPKASILYAVEVPDSGGDTHFCSMRHALDALSPELRDRTRALKLKHDAAHDSVGQLRPGFDHSLSPVGAPGCVHPMVTPHPETGYENLFLGRRQDAYVVGLELEESEKLLDQIWGCVGFVDHCWTQRWQVGDLVIWDNRVVMHRRGAFDPGNRRLMRRTQVRPIY